jgi:hypothetical protein
MTMPGFLCSQRTSQIIRLHLLAEALSQVISLDIFDTKASRVNVGIFSPA